MHINDYIAGLQLSLVTQNLFVLQTCYYTTEEGNGSVEYYDAKSEF